jgi:hypothetical protein
MHPNGFILYNISVVNLNKANINNSFNVYYKVNIDDDMNNCMYVSTWRPSVLW